MKLFRGVMPLAKEEPLPSSRSKDWILLHGPFQAVRSVWLLADSIGGFQCGNSKCDFLCVSYNSMVNYTRIYRGTSTTFKMFNNGQFIVKLEARILANSTLCDVPSHYQLTNSVWGMTYIWTW